MKGLCVINEIVVHKDHRGKMIGTFLVSKTKMHSIIDKQCSLFILTPLQKAVTFWEKQGFSAIKTLQVDELHKSIPVSYRLNLPAFDEMMFFKHTN